MADHTPPPIPFVEEATALFDNPDAPRALEEMIRENKLALVERLPAARALHGPLVVLDGRQVDDAAVDAIAFGVGFGGAANGLLR